MEPFSILAFNQMSASPEGQMDRSAKAVPMRAHPARFFVHLIVSLTLGFLLVACGGETLAPPPPVDAVVAQVVVEPNGHVLQTGEQLAFTTRVFDSKGAQLEGRYVTWSTSDEAVANVSASGVVTALSAGTVSIRATVEGTVGSARLDIENSVIASLNIGLEEVTMQQGESKTLTAIVKDTAGRTVRNRAIAWQSTDVTIVSVDPTGTITAVGPGSAEVTAQVDQIHARVVVNVTQPTVEQLVISPSEFTIELGETRQLEAVLKDKFGKVISGRPVLWTAINESVRIDENGVVTGMQPGEVMIIATSEGVSSIVTGIVATGVQLGWDLLYDRAGFAGMTELFILNPMTGQSPSLLSAGTMARTPSASPDGSRIAFAVSVEEYAAGERLDDIFVVDRDGSNLTRLTSAPGVDEAPAWSPTGDKIAYQHWEGDRTRGDIMLMDNDGSNPINLTGDLQVGFRSGAAWSRDGSRIAFVQTVKIVDKTWKSVWVMRNDGLEKHQLNSSLTADYGAPTWSHDGTRIAFVQRYADETDISIMNLVTGSVSRVRVPGVESDPSWSPDGSVIAFTSGGTIYTVRPDGSDVRLRTLDPEWGGAASVSWIARR